MSAARKSPCSDEQFVVIWETASNLAEVVRLAGYEGRSAPKIASRRAGNLRRRGVKLRPFDEKRVTAKLNWLAARARKEAQ